MSETILISVDGGCSGKRAACAAVLSVGGQIVAEKSRTLPGASGYALAAEVGAVALAADMVERIEPGDETVVIETDNPLVPRLLRGDYKPPGFHRIPQRLMEQARALCWLQLVEVHVLPRNSTAGLRRAHRLATARLWRKRRPRKPLR